MSKITFSNLKLKMNNTIKEVDFNGIKIEIFQYLPIENKYNLIMLALQNSKSERIYNPIKLNMYFNLYIVYMYSNINFTDKQRENEYELYDKLESNGLINLIIDNIPNEEYQELCDFLTDTQKAKEIEERSLTGLATEIINSLPTNALAMQDIVENFDQEKFQNVINFAKAANGGRDIN